MHRSEPVGQTPLKKTLTFLEQNRSTSHSVGQAKKRQKNKQEIIMAQTGRLQFPLKENTTGSFMTITK